MLGRDSASSSANSTPTAAQAHHQQHAQHHAEEERASSVPQLLPSFTPAAIARRKTSAVDHVGAAAIERLGIPAPGGQSASAGGGLPLFTAHNLQDVTVQQRRIK